MRLSETKVGDTLTIGWDTSDYFWSGGCFDCVVLFSSRESLVVLNLETKSELAGSFDDPNVELTE